MADQYLTEWQPENRAVGALRAIGQGLGMGWGDEAEAWIRSKLGKESYENLVKDIRGRYGNYAAQNPITSGAVELGSGAIPGVAAMLIPGGQAAGVSQLARSGLATAARMGALGAATGAVSGAGSANDRDRLAAAGQGALLGGTVGAAIPSVVRGTGSAGRWLAEKLNPTESRVNASAASKLSNALNNSGIKPSDIENTLAADRAMGVPSVLANASPGTSDLAEAVAQRTGKGAIQIESALTAQKQGARERVQKQVQKGLNPGDYYADEQNLADELRNKAKTLYDAAYSHGEVNDPRIMAVLQNPDFKKFYEKAQAISNKEALAAKLSGEDPSKFQLKDIFEQPNPVESFGDISSSKKLSKALANSGMKPDEIEQIMPVLQNPEFKKSYDEAQIKLKALPDVRTLDYIKRGIDAVIDRGYNGEGLAPAEASALRNLKNQFVKVIDENVPAYPEARKSYAGDMEVINAMRSGMKDFGMMDHEQVAKAVGEMSDAEKDAFRTGVARNLYGTIMNPSQNMNSAQRIIGSPETQKKLAPLFDNPGQFDLFKSALERESQLFQQSNKILGGSQTAKRSQMNAQLEDGNVGSIIADAMTGGPRNSLVNLVVKSFRNNAMSEKTATKLSDMLMSKDPHEVAGVVKFLEDQAAIAAPKAARESAISGGLTTGNASAIWPAPAGEAIGPNSPDNPNTGEPVNWPKEMQSMDGSSAEPDIHGYRKMFLDAQGRDMLHPNYPTVPDQASPAQ